MGNTSRRTSSRNGVIPSDPGPYEAIVVSHLDPEFMGGLEVEILRQTSSGNSPERTGNIVPVRYMSPFYGVTPFEANQPNDAYRFTQKSYGMWMVPPDVDTKVIVMFMEGNRAYGYWIGCVMDQYMNFQIPGKAATTLTTDATPTPVKGLKLPVGEYNKLTESATGRDPTRFLKPYDKDFTQVLEVQGLVADEIRGTTSSSARREVPSSVFGINTPGPIDKRPGAPMGKYGQAEAQADVFTNRLGGTTLVMDDGDDKILRKKPPGVDIPEYVNLEAGESGGDPTLPANELFRVRTRTGHQLLFHNTEDIVYIGNARGTAWLEFTSDGKIDIYAQDSISMYTDNDFNFYANRDVNIEAGRNINMRASAEYSDFREQDVDGNESGRVQIESNFNTNIEVGKDYRLTVFNKSDTHVFDEMKVLVDADYHFHTKQNRFQRSDQATHEESGHSWYRESESNIYDLAAGIVAIDAGGGGGPDIHLNSSLAKPATSPADAVDVVPLTTYGMPYVPPGGQRDQFGVIDTIMKRVPQHEPWPHHENLNPQEFKRTKTDRETSGTQPENSRVVASADTFRKAGDVIRSNSAGQSRINTNPNPNSPSSDNLSPQGGGSRNPPSGLPSSALGTRGTPGSATVMTASNIPGVITGLTPAQTAAYMNAIGYKESSNSYATVNNIGFVGRYQFGHLALIDTGYVRSGTPDNRALQDPRNWTGKNGVSSVRDWLSNGPEQDKAMVAYTNLNYRYVTNAGGLRTTETNPQEIAGMLAASHLVGAGGATRWRNSSNTVADANGTTAAQYYSVGSAAV